MKMIEIKCPSCGGKLKVEDSQTKLITCEFCGSQFLLDDEKDQNITNYNIYQTTPAGKGQNSASRLALILGGGLAVLLVFALAVSFASHSSKRTSMTVRTAPAYSHRKESETAEAEEAAEAKAVPESPLYQAMVADMFRKTPSEVGSEDLARVRYLKVETSLETDRVWYSFDDPYGAQEPQIKELSYGKLEWEPGDAEVFTGLVKLDLGSSLGKSVDISGMTDLRGITARGTEIRAIADMAADPGRIIELELQNITSMDGIPSFVNLERLSVKDMPDVNLKQLVPLKKLAYLKLEDTVRSDSIIPSHGDEKRVTDYSAISVMTGLKSLYLKSDIIKDIGFMKALPALDSLTLEDTSIISLEPLASMPSLTSLCLLGNNKVLDFKPVGMVSGLRELTIDKLTNQPDPDLSALSGLEKLDISGFMSISSLKGLQSLKDLSIHGCNVDGAGVLSSLGGVERLTFYSVWNSEGNLRNLDFLKGMTGLKYADFNGNLDGTGWSGYRFLIEVYGDVSSVFNHEGLEELYLDSGNFEINFDRIGVNPTLRVLGLRNLSLHKDYYVESYGGMTSVWYDDVTFSEHMDMFSKFPNLEELYLDGNELTDISFVTGLGKLKRLGIRDNYVTDLSPLARAEYLEYLDIRDNPVGDAGDMGEDVEIIR